MRFILLFVGDAVCLLTLNKSVKLRGCIVLRKYPLNVLWLTELMIKPPSIKCSKVY